MVLARFADAAIVPSLSLMFFEDRPTSTASYSSGARIETTCHMGMRSYARQVSVTTLGNGLRLYFVNSTHTSSTGLKTRDFGIIMEEIISCIRLHSENRSHLGGVSLEFTGELNEDGFSVTECLGGSMELTEEQLGLRYQVSKSISMDLFTLIIMSQSFCDPRLNFEQSLGM